MVKTGCFVFASNGCRNRVDIMLPLGNGFWNRGDVLPVLPAPRRLVLFFAIRGPLPICQYEGRCPGGRDPSTQTVVPQRSSTQTACLPRPAASVPAPVALSGTETFENEYAPSPQRKQKRRSGARNLCSSFFDDKLRSSIYSQL